MSAHDLFEVAAGAQRGTSLLFARTHENEDRWRADFCDRFGVLRRFRVRVLDQAAMKLVAEAHVNDMHIMVLVVGTELDWSTVAGKKVE